MLHSKLLAQILLSSSTYPVVLHSLPLILFCQRGCLSFCSRRAGCLWCMSPPDASACRTAICSSSLFLGSIGTPPAHRSTRTLFLSFTRSVSAILSLYAFILAFPVKVLSMIVLIRSRHFVLMWFCRSSMRCKRSTTRTTSSVSVSLNVTRQNVESSRLNLWRSLNHAPWQWGSRSLSAATFFVNFSSGATICRGVPHKPSKFVDSQASLSVCLVQLLPRTTPFLVSTELLLFDHDDQQRFLESCDLQQN